MEALNIGPAIQGFRNLFPILPAIYSDGLSELLVFDLGPMPLDFGIWSFRILCPLIFGGTTFVEMRVRHLVLDELPLGLDVVDAILLCIISLLMGRLELLNSLETCNFLLINIICIKWLHLRVLF